MSSLEFDPIAFNGYRLEFVEIKDIEVQPKIKYRYQLLDDQQQLEVLYKIDGNERYMHDTSMSNQSDFRRDLGDLWGRGFIRQKQGEKNVKDWYEVSDLGRKFIEIREKILNQK